MPVLLEKYKYISFPISDSSSNSDLLKVYLSEFEEDKLSFELFTKLLLNAIRDFISGNINELELSNIMHQTYISESTRAFHEAPYLWEHNKLLGFVSELSDIQWLKDNSPNFENYLEQVKKKWKEFVDIYNKS